MSSAQQRVHTTRLRLVGLLLGTLALGIFTRKLHLGVMLWDKSAGNALYAVAVYFAIALAFPHLATPALALLAFAFAFGIELFQLTGVPVALSHQWHWVHWFLGSTFAWHDVVCYAAGIPLAALVQRVTASAI